MELRELAHFVAVAEELHFSRAAARLQVAQPAVSQQVARLERELHVRLFERSSRVVRLTGAGQLLLVQARRVLEEVEGTRRLAAELAGGDRGLLRIGTTESMGWRLQEVLVAFREARSGVTVSVTSDHTPAKLAALRAGDLDCAFVRSAVADEHVHLLDLWEEPLVVLLPQHHRLARLPAVPLTALAAMPVVLVAREANPGAYDSFTALCQRAGITPVLGPAHRSTEDTLANIAASEDTWSPFHASHNALVEGVRVPGVAVRPFADVDVSARCSLAWPAADPAPAVAHLVAVVRQLRDRGAFAPRG